MAKQLGLLLVILVFAGVAAAQDEDWTPGEGGLEYHCGNLQLIQQAIKDGETAAVEAMGADPLAREGDNEISLNAYIGGRVLTSLADDPIALLTADKLFENATAACAGEPVAEDDAPPASADTFNIIVNGNVNLRSCPGTDCDVVGRAADGSLLKVLAEEGDWYQVELEDGSTAYIASRLTTRGPDSTISIDEPFTDPRTGCFIAFDLKRGDPTMAIVLGGDRRSEVVVDLTRPRETAPLRVEGQLDKEFIDTGDPYVLQYYRYNVRYPVGVYTLEISLDDQKSQLAWEITEQGDYTIHVYCD